MEVKIKKLYKDSNIPTKAHDTDAGFDLYACWKDFDDHGNILYGTGVAIDIPEGHAGLIFPRSSISRKSIYLTNAVGIIDHGYSGEIMLKFKTSYNHVRYSRWWNNLLALFKGIEINKDTITTTLAGNSYKVGDRIGQLIIIPYPSVEFKEVDELWDSERGLVDTGAQVIK